MCSSGQATTSPVKLRPKEFLTSIIIMTEVKGRIYKLYIAGIEDICYIGSTVNSLEHRLYYHKYSAKADNQTKAASSCLFDEENEVLIMSLEEDTYTSKQHMEERERYWIEQYPDCVNKNIPTRGWKERWEKNRDRNLELHKKWITDNKDQQAEYKAAKRKADGELAKQKDKEARERNKEKIAAAKKVRVSCPTCKKEMAKNSLWEHNKKVHSL
jgi:hypothetical protein